MRCPGLGLARAVVHHGHVQHAQRRDLLRAAGGAGGSAGAARPRLGMPARAVAGFVARRHRGGWVLRGRLRQSRRWPLPRCERPSAFAGGAAGRARGAGHARSRLHALGHGAGCGRSARPSGAGRSARGRLVDGRDDRAAHGRRASAAGLQPHVDDVLERRPATASGAPKKPSGRCSPPWIRAPSARRRLWKRRLRKPSTSGRRLAARISTPKRSASPVSLDARWNAPIVRKGRRGSLRPSWPMATAVRPWRKSPRRRW